MRDLRISWNTEDGRLVCHWIESGAGGNSHEVLKRIARSATFRGLSSQPLARSFTNVNFVFGLSQTA
jgi:hypothetical protein